MTLFKSWLLLKDILKLFAALRKAFISFVVD